jgi:hypothetical protein
MGRYFRLSRDEPLLIQDRKLAQTILESGPSLNSLVDQTSPRWSEGRAQKNRAIRQIARGPLTDTEKLAKRIGLGRLNTSAKIRYH